MLCPCAGWVVLKQEVSFGTVLSQALGDVLLTHCFWSLGHRCISPQRKAALPFSWKRIYRLSYYFLILMEYWPEIEMICPFISQIHIHLLCTRQTSAESVETVRGRPAVVSGSLHSHEKEKLSGLKMTTLMKTGVQDRETFQLWGAPRAMERSLEGWENWIYREGGGKGKEATSMQWGGAHNVIPVLAWAFSPPFSRNQSFCLLACPLPAQAPWPVAGSPLMYPETLGTLMKPRSIQSTSLHPH